MGTKILDRIKKLMELSKNNPNVNEAASAAAHVQELLDLHQLSLAEIEAAGGAAATKDEPIAPHSFPTGQRIKAAWRGALANGIARANGCHMYWNGTDI